MVVSDNMKKQNIGALKICSTGSGFCGLLLVFLALIINRLSSTTYWIYGNSDGSLSGTIGQHCGYEARWTEAHDKASGDSFHFNTRLVDGCNNITKSGEYNGWTWKTYINDPDAWCRQKEVGLLWYRLIIISGCLAIIPFILMVISVFKYFYYLEKSVNYFRWLLFISSILCLIAVIKWMYVAVKGDHDICWTSGKPQNGNKMWKLPGFSYIFACIAALCFMISFCGSKTYAIKTKSKNINVHMPLKQNQPIYQAFSNYVNVEPVKS